GLRWGLPRRSCIPPRGVPPPPGEGVGRRGRAASSPRETSRLGSALVDEESLRGAADRPALVIQRRVGDPDPARLGDRARLKAHPLPGWEPAQMDGEVDVDE